MARKYFGLGARGDLVGQIQRALAAAGHGPKDIDEIYGEDTLDAVVSYQGEKKLTITGVVDEATWNPLMRCPVPAVSERSLALTAAFEGHGYTLARGNFDGAWLTWGIIGFTLKSGQIQQIVTKIQSTFPQLIPLAFGRDAAKLIEIMHQPAPQQKAWATSLTVSGGDLAEQWKTGFAKFGSLPEVQAEQRRHANDNYYKPSVNAARALGISTELGLALMFDVHVQNGGLSAASMQQIREDIEASHDATEANIREIIADAVAGECIPKYRDDVRDRKMTIASGKGTVHGREYDLSNWGLADLAASSVGA